ncbi:hypothetical protein TcWFU_006023 [Taenia crassiceps]|uniref:Uncharacterized protein n=1 Tax=Taenia crassiceps TaxID=6207 RepID=A0ABR4QN40_9CEST
MGRKSEHHIKSHILSPRAPSGGSSASLVPHRRKHDRTVVTNQERHYCVDEIRFRQERGIDFKRLLRSYTHFIEFPFQKEPLPGLLSMVLT